MLFSVVILAILIQTCSHISNSSYMHQQLYKITHAIHSSISTDTVDVVSYYRCEYHLA